MWKHKETGGRWEGEGCMAQAANHASRNAVGSRCVLQVTVCMSRCSQTVPSGLRHSFSWTVGKVALRGLTPEAQRELPLAAETQLASAGVLRLSPLP